MTKRQGEVVAIKDLFEKYRNTLRAPQKSVELESVRVIGEITKIKLREDQVEYTVGSRVLVIKASSMVKQELRLKNKEVLDELKFRLGVKNCPQVIL